MKLFFILDEATTVTNKSSRSAQPRPSTTNRARQASSGRNRSSTILTVPSRRKREQQNENLQIAITELLNHFSHRNLDAIVRVIKMTLEKLRKRITTSLSYGN
jgi:dynein heavy chain